MQRMKGKGGRARLPLSACILAFTLLISTGCASKDTPRIVTEGAVEATGAVQATITAPNPGPNRNGASWPETVTAFAASFGRASWYPAYVPKAYSLRSLDVMEFDPGTGLVCDAIYSNGSKGIEFVQGSPKARQYDIISAGKVPWGSGTADIVYEDPSDTTSRPTIVLNRDGNLAELSGDVSFEELKAIAASMVSVR